MKVIRKKPEDYPLFSFRISPKIKKKLTSQIEDVQLRWSKDHPDEQRKLQKNEIIIKAIEVGLADFKKNGFRKLE